MEFYKDKEKLGKYMDYVDKSLQYFVQRKLRMERVDLSLKLEASDSFPVIDTWLPLALHSGVCELDFWISVYDYPLPKTTFVLNSSLLRSSFKFFCLQTLKLYQVILSENMVQDINRNCPNLVSLELFWVGGLKTLNISKPNKLEHLHICTGEEINNVSVDAPSLDHFVMYLDLPCARGVIDLTSCCNMRKLRLNSIVITDDLFNLHISRFPILEDLHISNCDLLRRIRISLQQLQNLRLVYCHRMEAIEIDAPNLSHYECSSGSHGLPELASTNIIEGGMDLYHDMHLGYGGFVNQYFLMIREYLSRAPFKSKVFTPMISPLVVYDPDQVWFNYEELRRAIIPPLAEVLVLDLSNLPMGYSSCWLTLLQGFMWSCHPKVVVMRKAADRNSCDEESWIKVFCNMVTGSKCLKAAKVKSIGGKFASNMKGTGGIEHEQFRYMFELDSKVFFELDWDHSPVQGLAPI